MPAPIRHRLFGPPAFAGSRSSIRLIAVLACFAWCASGSAVAATGSQADICYSPSASGDAPNKLTASTPLDCPQAGHRTLTQLAQAGWSVVAAAADPQCPQPYTPTAQPAAPMPDPLSVTAAEKPFDTYQAPGTDALAWAGAYYAASGAAPDYAIAARLEPAFQRTTDAFAQQDVIAGTKTKLDAAIAAAKANPYVRLPPVVAQLPTYDLAHQRYDDFADLVGPTMGLTVADGAAQIRFAPNPALSGYAPAHETEARTLEHAIASNPLNRQIQYTVFGKVGVVLHRC